MAAFAVLALGLALGAEQAQGCPPPPPCPACPACPAPAPTPPPKHWTGNLGLGLVSVTGNARSLTFNFNASLEHKTADWILSGKAVGTYGEARAGTGGPSQISAENASLFLRGDWRVTRPFSVYLLGGMETDHPKSVEVRHSQESGVGYAWIDETRGDEKLFLRTDAGMRLAEEYRFQYFPTPGAIYPRLYFLKAPRAAVAFHREVDKRILFSQDLEVIPNLGESRVLANSVTKLTTKLLGPLGFGVSYTVNYDSAPPPPKIPWDTTLAVTLEYLL